MNHFIKLKNNAKGESLIIAIIIMLILFIVGAAILTSASSGMSSVAKRSMDRQAYYVAKSSVGTFRSALEGEMGTYILNLVYQDLQDSGIPEGQGKAKSNWLLDPAITFTEPDIASSLQLKDVEITFASNVKIVEGSSPQEVEVTLENVKIAFTGAYEDSEYYLEAIYSYKGFGTLQGSQVGWNGIWELKNVSQ